MTRAQFRPWHTDLTIMGSYPQLAKLSIVRRTPTLYRSRLLFAGGPFSEMALTFAMVPAADEWRVLSIYGRVSQARLQGVL